MIRCGNCKGRHELASDVRYCYAVDREERAAAEAEAAVELAYERSLEDSGYWEARLDEDRERALA